MNESGSIVEFFYNIVPGALFLFVLNYFSLFDLSLYTDNSDTLTIFAYIVLSLFLGFLFQGITIILRHNFCWNDRNFEKVKQENSRFNETYETFQDTKLSNKDFFYLMDNCLRKERASFLPTHFSSLFAFWANMFCVTLGFLLLYLFLGRRQIYYSDSMVIPFFIGFTLINWYFADKFLKSFYDTILNSYYMLEVSKNKKKR